MKNSLRYIIREQIEKLLEADAMNPAGEAINDIQAQVSDTLEYLKNLEDETKNKIKMDNKLLNIEKQTKSNSPTTLHVSGKTVANPERKALDQKLPAKEKVIQAQEDGLKQVEKAKANYEKMADDLSKKEIEIAKSQKSGDSKSSVLPSLDSPI
jgi:uncharacterized protein YhaN